jgi:hypothetical protein
MTKPPQGIEVIEERQARSSAGYVRLDLPQAAVALKQLPRASAGGRTAASKANPILKARSIFTSQKPVFASRSSKFPRRLQSVWHRIPLYACVASHEPDPTKATNGVKTDLHFFPAKSGGTNALGCAETMTSRLSPAQPLREGGRVSNIPNSFSVRSPLSSTYAGAVKQNDLNGSSVPWRRQLTILRGSLHLLALNPRALARFFSDT